MVARQMTDKTNVTFLFTDFVDVVLFLPRTNYTIPCAFDLVADLSTMPHFAGKVKEGRLGLLPRSVNSDDLPVAAITRYYVCTSSDLP